MPVDGNASLEAKKPDHGRLSVGVSNRHTHRRYSHRYLVWRPEGVVAMDSTDWGCSASHDSTVMMVSVPFFFSVARLFCVFDPLFSVLSLSLSHFTSVNFFC